MNLFHRLILSILLTLCGLAAAAQQPTLFKYPEIPDSIADIGERYDFYVSHFWDRADTKAIFSSRQRFADAFEDYIVPLRYARADTVHSSVRRFMQRLEKQPKEMLYVGSLAEDLLYGDSALYVSDELYLSFLKPILRNKKIDRNLKARFASQYIRLNNSLQGHPMAAVPYTRPDGTTALLEARPGVPLVVFLADPECTDCRLAGVRLKADARTAQLVEAGAIDVAVLMASEVDDNLWREYAASFPEEWKTGTNPDLDTILDMRAGTPAFYLLDENGRIALKNINIDTVLTILGRL